MKNILFAILATVLMGCQTPPNEPVWTNPYVGDYTSVYDTTKALTVTEQSIMLTYSGKFHSLYCYSPVTIKPSFMTVDVFQAGGDSAVHYSTWMLAFYDSSDGLIDIMRLVTIEPPGWEFAGEYRKQ